MRLHLFIAAFALGVSTLPAFSEEAAPKPTAVDAIKRLQLQRIDYPPELYASMIYSVDIAPGGLVARHTHPGVVRHSFGPRTSSAPVPPLLA